jgi:hypothetical protein
MVFSNSNVSKPRVRTLNSSPSPIQNTSTMNEAAKYSGTHVGVGGIRGNSRLTVVESSSLEFRYYMQNSMIGRLMNTKKCASCPKH